MKTMLGVWMMMCLCSCSNLYYWGSYNSRSYMVAKNSSEEEIEQLMKTYDDITTKYTIGQRKMIPPGICADYGYFQMKAGNIDRGKYWLEKERTLYPEATTLVNRILKTYEKNENDSQ